jgi:hypothetical protein
MDPLIDQQSAELDRDRRLKHVWDIERKLEADVARPMLGWRNEYFTRRPTGRHRPVGPGASCATLGSPVR